jgi:hypothetical protein
MFLARIQAKRMKLIWGMSFPPLMNAVEPEGSVSSKQRVIGKGNWKKKGRRRHNAFA